MVDRDESDVADTVAHWPFDEGTGSTAKEVVSGRRNAVEHAFDDARFQADSDPRWIDGVDGHALLFDGYSTGLTHEEQLFDGETAALSIEAWIAPRAFEGRASERLSAIVSNHAIDDDRGFEFGLDGHGRCSLQVGLGNSWESVRADDPLSRYDWSHVAAVFDGDDGVLALHVDGECVASQQIQAESAVVPADVPVLVGANNETESVGDAFELNRFAGAIDELRISDRALEDADIEARYESSAEEAQLEYETIALDPSRYSDDRHRPQYHPIPPGHWMNEPHAPMYHDGQYHLFYQHNPSGPYWGNIHWGHWVSDDLVHWRHLRPALAPEIDGLAPDGIWSGGSTHDADGEPVVLFTAGDMDRTPDQRVVTARPENPDDPQLASWRQADEAAIERPHSIGLRDNDFRDPYVWREDGTWYCLVGSGFDDGRGGAALIYESASLDEWEFRGCLHSADAEEYPELGHVWELPVLLPVGEDETGAQKHVLVISPIEGAAEVEVYYWLGEWDAAACRFDPDHEAPRLIDYGDFHFTGPHGMVDPETGRSLLFTIAQDGRRPQDHYDAGWAHNGGLPLHLFLRDDGRLGIEPIEELQTLRAERLAHVEDADLSSANDELAGVGSSTAEIRTTMASGGAQRYGLRVRAAPDGSEETFIYYDERTGRIVVHREHSTRNIETRTAVSERSSLVHRGDIALDGEDLDLHVYLDGSMLEVYVNGLKSVTTRLYPEDDRSVGIEAWADGDVTIEQLAVWKLDSAYE
ncbi:Sucrose-6-phosphate hydrolase SacC, GH32 family [Natronoarchaeum philippinense]|uniref:beta-fructofuranosidase n=1 Tax=Natronoarchaeum philippinense TaxID=558529 RepID=A0A285P539_NATPI|nr:GH32 C-terminal domain-containing protein [Natronoarchaeum philippinense]SNZ16834.1 Sucrose-6-phosphate hydrolase SacC, GH32 family [Natronoarchaeum philippinense]